MSTDTPEPGKSGSDKPVTSPRITGQDRMTLNLRLVHERHGKEAHEAGCRFDCSLRTSEQPVGREVEVSSEPTPLPAFWLGPDVGCVLVTNPLPVYARNPTAEQRAADMSKVVQVWLGDEAGPRPVVRPGRCFLAEFEPGDAARVRLSCKNGPVKVRVDLLPA